MTPPPAACSWLKPAVRRWSPQRLNDRKNLETILATAHTLDPEDALAREIIAQLKAKPRGELSLAKLLPEASVRPR